MKLYTKISIGLMAGVVVGIGVNLTAWEFGANVVAAIENFGIGWIRLITMVVIPLVVASLVVGAASLGDLRSVGRVGGKTVAYYLITTSVAVSIGLILSNVIKPGSGLSEASREGLLAEYGGEAAGRIDLAQQAPGIVELLLNMIPRNPISAAANTEMLPLILFSILFGIAATTIREDRRKAVLGFFEGVNDISMQLIRWIMVLAPYAVFVLIAGVTARFGFEILQSLLWYAGTVALGLLLHAFVTFSLILKFLARLSPLEFFRRIRAAQLLGFSTSSSSATLPVTIQIAEENLGVSKKIASFVLPLGATVNMDGTALYQGVAVMFIAQVFGIELSLFAQLTVVLTATLASIGAAGVPSAGIITLTIVLVQAGVPETGIALILGVDRILDMLRTSVNITGDLTGTVLIAQTEGESLDLSQRLETKESVGAA